MIKESSMKKALLQIIFFVLFFQQALAAEDPREEFMASVRALPEWQLEAEDITLETDARLPYVGPATAVTLRGKPINCFEMEGETIDGNTNFNTELFGEAVRFTYDSTTQPNNQRLRLTVEGREDPLLLTLTGIEGSPQHVNVSSTLTTFLTGMRGAVANVLAVYEGEIEGSLLKVKVDLGLLPVSLRSLLYGRDREHHRTGVFGDFYVTLFGGEQTFDPRLLRTINHTLGAVEERNRARALFYDGRRVHYITDTIAPYSCDIQWGGSLAPTNYEYVSNTVREKAISELLHVEGERIEMGDYRSSDNMPTSSLHIHSDGHGELYSTIHVRENWTNSEEVKAVSLFYKGVNLLYDPNSQNHDVIGALEGGIWPEGVYHREHRAEDPDFYIDRWRNLLTNDLITLRLNRRFYPFYEILQSSTLNEPLEAYPLFPFKNFRMTTHVEDWGKVNDILSRARFESVEIRKTSGIDYEPFQRIVPGLRSNGELRHLDLDGCFINDIDPLIELVQNLPRLEQLYVRGVHKSDHIPFEGLHVEREKTGRLARAIGNLEQLRELHFDMAYTGSNRLSGFKYGAKAGGELPLMGPIAAIIKPADLVTGFAANIFSYVCEGDSFPHKVLKFHGTFGLRGKNVSMAVAGGILGGTGGILKDGLWRVLKRSDPRAMEIIRDIARAPHLRRIQLGKVTFDYNRQNFREELTRSHPGITVEYYS